MAEPQILLVRLGSLGDIVHALPSAASLRDAFPAARIDWAVESKWERLLVGNPDLSNVIVASRSSMGGFASTFRGIRAAKYSCVIDFQALYKSALLAFATGAPERIGFASSYAREGLASFFYTARLNPRGPHKVDHNFTLAQSAGAKSLSARFPLAILPEDEEEASRALAANKLKDFFVLNPGGGWISKCWPAERYGQVHQRLAQQTGWRGVVTFGPGEESLAHAVISAAGSPSPVALPLRLGPLMALLKRARFMVSADTGPLHMAAALGAPVVGLYGPTDPCRNGPYSRCAVVVRNPRESETTYRRGASHSAAMLSITVDQVMQACERLLQEAA